MTLLEWLALLGMAANGAPAQEERMFERRFERTLSVSGPVDLEVTTGAGHVAVRAGEPGQVRIIAIVSAPNAVPPGRLHAVPPIVQEGNRIRVGADAPEWLSGRFSMSYGIVTPPETRLRARTGAGEQRVAGIRGPVDSTAGSGGLEFADIAGEVRARTGLGNIQLSGVFGDVLAVASNGSISGDGIAGSIRAQTGVGHVRFDNSPAPDLEVTASSGNVEVAGVRGSVRVWTGVGNIAVEGAPCGAWNLEAGAGNVLVRRPAESGLDLYARTSSGRIEAAGETYIRRVLRRRLLGGGPPLHVRTGVGNIRIELLEGGEPPAAAAPPRGAAHDARLRLPL